MNPQKDRNERKSLPILREFIYLDRPKLEDFLSGVEEGLVRQIKEGEKTTGRQVQGNINLGVGGVGGKGRVSESLREFILEATDASLFQRLYSLDRDEPFITHVDIFNQEQWLSMEEGQVIEVEAAVNISELERIFDTISDLLQLMEVIQPGALEDAKSKQIIGLLQLRKRNAVVGVRIEPVKSPSSKYQFVASLRDEFLRGAKSELSGNFRVFGRIQKKLKSNEKYDLFKLLPTEFQLGSKEMREFLRKFKDMPPILGKTPSMKDIKVGYPAMVLTPVAVYR